MSSTLHTDQELARFRDPIEGAQVWAAWRDEPDRRWFFLERGAADDARELTRSALQCPVPGCPSPALSTRGGLRRDHFFHLTPGGGHGDNEGMFHLQSKHMLAEWLRDACPPGTEVREEVSLKEQATRLRRRPDVLAALPDGTRWAVEIEYKGFAHASWAAKDAEYARAGINVIWIFGHTRRWLPFHPSPTSGEGTTRTFEWRSLPRAVAASGRPVFFVNPIERMIGIAFSEAPDAPEEMKAPEGVGFGRAVDHWWKHAEDFGLSLTRTATPPGPQLAVHSLEACTFDAVDGLVTPTHTVVAASRREVEARALDAKRSMAERWTKEHRARSQRIEASRSKPVRILPAADWQLASTRDYLLCRVCSGYLDPVLRQSMRHIGC